MKRIFITLVCALGVLAQLSAKEYAVSSPDGDIAVTVEVGETVTWSLNHGSDLLIEPSAISMTLSDGAVYGLNDKVVKVSRKTVDNILKAHVYKKSQVKDHYNEMTLKFKEFSLVFRVYDDGAAYRFISHSKKPFQVESEQAVFAFAKDWNMWVPYVCQNVTDLQTQLFNSFENRYEYGPISKWNKERLSFLPLMVDGPSGKKIVITESDLMNYPGMYLYNNGDASKLDAVFANRPKDLKQGGYHNLQMLIESREPYIASFDGATSFPWRIVSVSDNDAQMADSDMVWKLATPAEEADWSWVKPGKVAWDWWNAWNLYGVDFRAGINNDTYKYYIDFASKYGIEYVILDEGWAVNLKADLFQVIPEIDLEALVAYANERNVGLILWAGYWAFDREMEKVCKHYSKMGIKGFKVDFMNRDDQIMVDFYRRAAEMSAKYGLLLDFHGAFKPAGLQRTYPNVVNFEGVFGLEQLKWSKEHVDMVTYDVTMPFIRMFAGPVDYTQGAMRNAIKKNYRPVNSEAMSQGTRCHQLAEYVVFESPLNMLCDSPSNYIKEDECTRFISSVPTVWDETRTLDCKVGKYVSIARRSGDVWYVGALTGWDARNLNLNLDFLPEGDYQVEIFRDGINADRAACDYRREVAALPADRILKAQMAPGGGYVARISKATDMALLRPAGQEDVIGLTAAPMETVRIGIIGVGMRGKGAVRRFTKIPGAEVVALCDLSEKLVKESQQTLVDAGKKKAAEYYGSEDAWKELCKRDDVDLVYVVTDWENHAKMGVYAMEHGKHVAIEVPAALTLDEIWQLVNTSERTRKHCMQLENCIYDFFELTTLNMAQQGLFGEILHVEGAYIHNLEDFWHLYWDNWRLKYNSRHRGDVYPTHGLGPVCQLLDIHRGDRMKTLVSMDTKVVTGPVMMEKLTGQKCEDFKNADHTLTMVRTEKGKTILIEHNVMTPRPYDRMYQLSGTNGFANKYPVEQYLFRPESANQTEVDHEDLNAHKPVSEEVKKNLMEKYKHRIHKDLEEMAKKVGGHGGMDYIMDFRLIYCLRNGLPLDMDVYDLAEWCSFAPLSRMSIENGNAPVAVPDFTRGAWEKVKGYRHAFVD